MIQSGERYDTTREAWENIWAAAGSVEKELAAARSARSLETFNTYLPYLPKDAPILEAGCGLSSILLLLKEQGFNPLGMDYAVTPLHISHQYDASLRLYAGDVHTLPHAENSIGAYLSFGVLEHFEHGMIPALTEAHRVLMPDGILVLTIPYPNLIYRLVQLKRRLRGENLLTDEDFYESTYTRRALEQNVTQAGFTLVKSLPTSHSFTFWGLGGPFRGSGYYRTSPLAELSGRFTQAVLPWAFNFTTLVIARK